MATQLHNLSEYDPATLPDASGMKMAIVVSEWHYEITSKLLEGARSTLIKNGVSDRNILIRWVPGSYELIYAAANLMRNREALTLDAIIVLGSVIRGETPHFDYVCSGVTQGIAALNARGEMPVIFGLLTDDNWQQALDRSGGKYGNKGDGAAVTAIKMAAFK